MPLGVKKQRTPRWPSLLKLKPRSTTIHLAPTKTRGSEHDHPYRHLDLVMRPITMMLNARTPHHETSSPRRRPGSRSASWQIRTLDAGLRRHDESWCFTLNFGQVRRKLA
jgi:hypothetical protein